MAKLTKKDAPPEFVPWHKDKVIIAEIKEWVVIILLFLILVLK